ncbi:MAG TPA: CopG family transcriptional regulator [Candidatus Limnocylindrales bacterium]
MIRTQISLTESQMRRLRKAAKDRQTSIAAVIRDAVDATVPDEEEERRKRFERALAFVGAGNSGLGDLAERHDDYLAENDRW